MDGIRRSAGIDWAKDAHAVCVIDEHGTVLERYEVEHTATGLRDLVHRLRASRVSGIAIERPDGPVIDALFAADLRVVVIASRHVKALRSRYGSAGNKDDHSDAYILADVLRTDGQRLRPLLPDSEATYQPIAGHRHHARQLGVGGAAEAYAKRTGELRRSG
jgi:transposase